MAQFQTTNRYIYRPCAESGTVVETHWAICPASRPYSTPAFFGELSLPPILMDPPSRLLVTVFLDVNQPLATVPRVGTRPRLGQLKYLFLGMKWIVSLSQVGRHHCWLCFHWCCPQKQRKPGYKRREESGLAVRKRSKGSSLWLLYLRF